MNITITVHRVPKGTLGKPQPTLVKAGVPGHGRKVEGGHKPAKYAKRSKIWESIGAWGFRTR